MFNAINHQKVSFSSNPPLPDKPEFTPLADERGVITNHLQYVPNSHESLFDGVIYDPNTMSLRAQLSMGIPLREVSIGQLENDPTRLHNNALQLENSIQSKLMNLSSESTQPESTE